MQTCIEQAYGLHYSYQDRQWQYLIHSLKMQYCSFALTARTSLIGWAFYFMEINRFQILENAAIISSSTRL